MADVATLIGMLGVAIVVLAYALFAAHKISGDGWQYPVLNIVGTSGILYSLLYQWNLPSFVTQVTWIVLSLVGLARQWRRKRRA